MKWKKATSHTAHKTSSGTLGKKCGVKKTRLCERRQKTAEINKRFCVERETERKRKKSYRHDHIKIVGLDHPPSLFAVSLSLSLCAFVLALFWNKNQAARSTVTYQMRYNSKSRLSLDVGVVVAAMMTASAAVRNQTATRARVISIHICLCMFLRAHTHKPGLMLCAHLRVVYFITRFFLYINS